MTRCILRKRSRSGRGTQKPHKKHQRLLPTSNSLIIIIMPVLTPEGIEFASAVFTEMDADGSGTVSKTELADAAKTFAAKIGEDAPSDEEIEARIAALEFEEITLENFLVFCAMIKLTMSEYLLRGFGVGTCWIGAFLLLLALSCALTDLQSSFSALALLVQSLVWSLWRPLEELKRLARISSRQSCQKSGRILSSQHHPMTKFLTP